MVCASFTAGGGGGGTKYDCINGTCQQSATGSYTDSTCNNTCVQQKYDCVNGVCSPKASGAYTSPTCNGACGGGGGGTGHYSCKFGFCMDDPTSTNTDPTCGGACLPNQTGGIPTIALVGVGILALVMLTRR